MQAAADAQARAESFEQAASHAFAPLRIRPVRDDAFTSSFRSAAAGGVVVTKISCDPCSVRRYGNLISSTDPDMVKVALHLSGKAGVEQDGRQCLLAPGDLVNYTTSRPYELRFWEPFETVVLGVPRGMLGGHAEAVTGRTAIRVPTDSAARRVVGTFIRTISEPLESELEVFRGNAGRHLADALVSMVISELVDVPVAQLHDELADRILAYCATHLADPSLSAQTVARAHRISVRYVHKVLQDREVTLSAWIRSQRLERIRRDLADPALTHRTVAAIAARWGVLSAPHLSRALRAEFGQTAAEIRRLATHG